MRDVEKRRKNERKNERKRRLLGGGGRSSAQLLFMRVLSFALPVVLRFSGLSASPLLLLLLLLLSHTLHIPEHINLFLDSLLFLLAPSATSVPSSANSTLRQRAYLDNTPAPLHSLQHYPREL